MKGPDWCRVWQPQYRLSIDSSLLFRLCLQVPCLLCLYIEPATEPKQGLFKEPKCLLNTKWYTQCKLSQLWMSGQNCLLTYHNKRSQRPSRLSIIWMNNHLRGWCSMWLYHFSLPLHNFSFGIVTRNMRTPIADFFLNMRLCMVGMPILWL